MEKLKKALKKIKGENVNIYTRHRLFGEDHIKCEHFIPVIEKGAGFEFRGQKIYILYNNINSYEIINSNVIINGHNNQIEITKMG